MLGLKIILRDYHLIDEETPVQIGKVTVGLT